MSTINELMKKLATAKLAADKAEAVFKAKDSVYQELRLDMLA